MHCPTRIPMPFLAFWPTTIWCRRGGIASRRRIRVVCARRRVLRIGVSSRKGRVRRRKVRADARRCSRQRARARSRSSEFRKYEEIYLPDAGDSWSTALSILRLAVHLTCTNLRPAGRGFVMEMSIIGSDRGQLSRECDQPRNNVVSRLIEFHLIIHFPSPHKEGTGS
jgi:hypothetical protein